MRPPRVVVKSGVGQKLNVWLHNWRKYSIALQRRLTNVRLDAFTYPVIASDPHNPLTWRPRRCSLCCSLRHTVRRNCCGRKIKIYLRDPCANSGWQHLSYLSRRSAWHRLRLLRLQPNSSVTEWTRTSSITRRITTRTSSMFIVPPKPYSLLWTTTRRSRLLYEHWGGAG